MMVLCDRVWLWMLFNWKIPIEIVMHIQFILIHGIYWHKIARFPETFFDNIQRWFNNEWICRNSNLQIEWMKKIENWSHLKHPSIMESLYYIWFSMEHVILP